MECLCLLTPSYLILALASALASRLLNSDSTGVATAPMAAKNKRATVVNCMVKGLRL